MILGENVGSVFSEGKEIKQVYSYGKLVWEKGDIEPIDYSVIPFTVRAIDDNVKISAYKGDVLLNLKYSINGSAWQTANEINIIKKDTVSIKLSTDDTSIRFSIEGLSDVYGNIMSLMYGDSFVDKTFWKFIFQGGYGLFQNCDIRHAKNLILPSTTMQSNGYRLMFYNCISLLSAPELPATTLDDYCYSAMFSGCSSLIKPPSILPAKNIKTGCYSAMFYSCSSLTTAPELPATSAMVDSCYYNMFNGCSSLTTAPELPATTLARDCYGRMFNGCNKLNYIKCYAKYNLKYITSNWTYGVSQTGVLVCEGDAAQTLKSTIPDTWTIEYID